MRHRVSILPESLGLFDPELPNLPVNGANLATVEMLRRIAVHPRVEALEVFLAPDAMAQVDLLARVARQILPPTLRGQGRLSFYPMHSLPDVWADARPRILWSMDPDWMSRDRYLRDRFAAGPTPIACDTHGFGRHGLWRNLAPLAAAPHVAFDSIVSLSSAARTALERMLHGLPSHFGAGTPCRLDLIPRGVDIDLFHTRDSQGKEEARRRLRLPSCVRIALFLGRVTAHGKADLPPLIRAFAAASSSNDILVIAGEEYPAGYGEKLLEFGGALGLGERLLVHPRVPPALRPLYYGAADLFVFPGDTVQETLGNTVLEAMASGLPCIVSDWNGMRDTMRDGVTGIAIPTWWMPGLERMDALSPVVPMMSEYLLTAQRVWVDTETLKSALAALLSSPETCAAMGAAGRAWAETEFSWDAVMDRWMDLWDELSAGAAREPESDRAVRRAHANRLGIPTQYDQIFSHYATAAVDNDRDSVHLTAYGHSVAAGAARIPLHVEMLATTQRAIFDTLLQIFTQAESQWVSVGDVMRQAAAAGHSTDKVRFHLCILLKRDVLQLRRDK